MTHRQLASLCRKKRIFYSTLSRRRLNAAGIQPLGLIAIIFNRLGQYDSILLRKNRRFFPITGRNHRQFSFDHPQTDGQAEFAWMAWLNTKTVYSQTVTNLSKNH